MNKVKLSNDGKYWIATYRSSTGRRQRRSLGSMQKVSRASAEARALEIEHEMYANPGRADTESGHTLIAWREAYFDLRRDLSPRTIKLHTETFNKLQAHWRNNKRIDRITRADAAVWEAKLHRKLSDATTCKHVRNAKAIFKRACDLDIIPFNPFDRLRSTPREIDRAGITITAEQIARVIDAAVSPPTRALIALCAYAGVRRSEAMALTWGGIQWDSNRITIEHTGARTTKKRTRQVLMVPELEAILLDVHDVTDAAGPATAGTCNIERKVTRAYELAGITKPAKILHSLRGWRATTWRTQYPEHVVDAWLGHSLAVARKHYAAVPESMYQRVDEVSEVDRLKAEVARLRAALPETTPED